MESDGDNVVFLAFKTEQLADDTMAFQSCVVCRNKTFTVVEDKVGDFPLMRCAACGQHIGRIGWAEK